MNQVPPLSSIALKNGSVVVQVGKKIKNVAVDLTALSEHTRKLIASLYVFRVKEDDVLSALTETTLKNLSQDDVKNFTVLAARLNHGKVVEKLCATPHKIAALSHAILCLSNPLPKPLSGFLSSVSKETLPHWQIGRVFNPCEKITTQAATPELISIDHLSAEDAIQLAAHNTGFSFLEEIIIQSLFQEKNGTRMYVDSILLHAVAHYHEQWKTQTHPVVTGHTVYDVLATLMDLKGYTHWSVWARKFATKLIQRHREESIIQMQLDIIQNENNCLDRNDLWGVEKTDHANAVKEWLARRIEAWKKTAPETEIPKLWETPEISEKEAQQQRWETIEQYRDSVQWLLGRLKEYTDVLSDPTAWRVQTYQHPLADFYDWAGRSFKVGEENKIKNLVSDEEIVVSFNAVTNWNLFPHKKPAARLVRTFSLAEVMAENTANSPAVDDKTFAEYFLRLLTNDSNTVLRDRLWNELWNMSDRRTQGPLTCGALEWVKYLENCSVLQRWNAVCLPDTDAAERFSELLSDQVKQGANPDDFGTVFYKLGLKMAPTTIAEFKAHYHTLNNNMNNLIGWEEIDQKSETPMKPLFSEESRKSCLDGIKRQDSDVIKSWSRFLTDNPNGLRRSARARAALDQIAVLREGFPHFEKIVDLVENDLALACMGKGDFFLPPLIMDGPPGTGKTFFFNELARISQNDFHIFNMESITASSTFTGLDRMWGNTAPGELFEKMIQTSACINPIVLLDELDKTTQDSKFPVMPALLSLLEPHSAKKFVDRSVQLKTDFSWISWVATTNDLALLSPPLKSRFRVENVPAPDLNARKKMARIIERGLRQHNTWGLGFREVPEETLDVLCAERGSARNLRKNLMSAFSRAAREGRSVLLPSDIPLPENIAPAKAWDTVFEKIPDELLEKKR